MREKREKLGIKKAEEYLCFSVQLKPVGNACNLKCKYCYARPHFISDKIMPKEILECVVRKTLQASRQPTFSWHGGEPTCVGINFFKSFVNLVEKYRIDDQQVRNLIQTNATKITPKLAEIFREYNFGVSVSLDGPEHVHGINRLFPNNRNSFSYGMKGVKLLRERGIDPSVICTVSRETLPFASEVFEFLISQGFKRIKYSPVFDSVNDEFSVTNEEWYDYLRIVFHKWFDLGDPSVQVRDLDEVIMWLSQDTFNLCSVNRTCLCWISINSRGEVYPCEYLRSEFCYGNILHIDLIDIPTTPAFQRFKGIYEKVPSKCQRCEFYQVCGNGCPVTRVKDGKIALDGVYAFCEERKQLFFEIRDAFAIALKGDDEK